ncbi:MAG: hypothetical protein EA427_11415 [Spirochaetaceae bacterium]|nr:MAG: hypothetical protein EA427_11415 [Spirochaetaceae bacterium]
MTGGTLLLRQINPSFIQEGRVTSQAFRPTPKDKQLLSVYDGDLIEPAAAVHHFIEVLECRSAGCMAVTRAECSGFELDVRSDPDPFPEHAVIDFAVLNEGQKKSASKRLRDHAETRGWLHKLSSFEK